ncbi:MAG: hypothetical protein ACRC2R_08990 [Xenococcaceae cyanobacterium]
MIDRFRTLYPQGSLIGELVKIDCGKYIVRALVQVDGVTLATGLAAADRLEVAEDRARQRALELLDLDSSATNFTRSLESETARQQTIPAPSETSFVTSVSSQASQEEMARFEKPTSVVDEEFISHNYSSSTSDNDVEEESSEEKTSSWFDEDDREPENAIAHIEEETSITQKNGFTSTPPTEIQTTLFDESFNSNLSELDEENERLLAQKNFENKAIEDSKTITSDNFDSEPFDAINIIAETDIELKRLGWTSQEGRDFLVQNYGKRSRTFLTDKELTDFLKYLRSQPTPS